MKIKKILKLKMLINTFVNEIISMIKYLLKINLKKILN